MDRTLTDHERLLQLMLSYDLDTGVFLWRSKPAPCVRAGSVAGSPDKDGYLRIQLDGKQHKLHRLAFLLVDGAWPIGQVDHIDGDRQNNRWANLRVVNQAINQQNRRQQQRGARTGLLGVYQKKGNVKFTARIYVDGKRIHLGSYECAEVAHAAYVRAKRELHQGCTL